MNKHRRTLNYKRSDKTRLSSDAKIIFALTKKQPQDMKGLCTKAGINRSTGYRDLRLLINHGVLKEIKKGWFALSSYEDIEEKVDQALKLIAEAGNTQVSTVDVGNMVGVPPNKVEDLTYCLAPKHGLLVGPKTTAFVFSRETKERFLRRFAEERKKA